MPHDANNTPLAEGDEVILRATVKLVQTGEDYCNITIESIHGRKPDGLKETISAINAAVLEKVAVREPGIPKSIADDPVYGHIRAAIMHEYVTTVGVRQTDVPKTDWLYHRLLESRALAEELQQLIDLQHTRTVRADKLWQQATGRHTTLPDLGTLIDWLLDKADEPVGEDGA